MILDAGSVMLSSLGRILQLDVTVKNVCPNKRVALAVILTEVDQNIAAAAAAAVAIFKPA